MKLEIKSDSYLFWPVWIAVWLVVSMAIWPTDDSDTSRWHRSGLNVRVDAKTGVNYVGSGIFGLGGLVVRVDTNGLPVVTKP